jgi:ABC-type proline/glycine betaine transport system substrate-binding protein
MLADRRLRLLLASGILALVLGLAATAGAQTDAGEAPLPPRDVHAEDADGEKVQLVWQPPLAGEADTYHVYRLDSQAWTQVATTVNTSANVTIGEHDGTAFHVTAANEAGESAPSGPVVAVETNCEQGEASTGALDTGIRCAGYQTFSISGLDLEVLESAPCIGVKPGGTPPVVINPGCVSNPEIQITVSATVRL